MLIQSLERKLRYHFNDARLLKQALTHRSASAVINNERLEFLGDAILGHIIATLLFQAYPDAREGELSHMRSKLVRRDYLAHLARKLDFGSVLKLSVGEKKSGGHRRCSILSDAFEAVIGALYLDGGIKAASAVLTRLYLPGIDQFLKIGVEKDAKSALQEWLQARKMSLPTYKVKAFGEAHALTFHVTCVVKGLPQSGEGTSTNRRQAEQESARNFLELLHEK